MVLGVLTGWLARRERELPPVPQRLTSWQAFLKAHWPRDQCRRRAADVLQTLPPGTTATEIGTEFVPAALTAQRHSRLAVPVARLRIGNDVE
jgi:hypothetical protein